MTNHKKTLLPPKFQKFVEVFEKKLLCAANDHSCPFWAMVGLKKTKIKKKPKKYPIFDQKFRKKYFSKLIKNGFYLFS